jgi:hypothetical protein
MRDRGGVRLAQGAPESFLGRSAARPARGARSADGRGDRSAGCTAADAGARHLIRGVDPSKVPMKQNRGISCSASGSSSPTSSRAHRATGTRGAAGRCAATSPTASGTTSSPQCRRTWPPPSPNGHGSCCAARTNRPCHSLVSRLCAVAITKIRCPDARVVLTGRIGT